MLISFGAKSAFLTKPIPISQHVECQYSKGYQRRRNSPIFQRPKKIFLLKNLVYKINYFTFVSN